MMTFAQQAKRIQNKYKGRTDKLSMDSMHRELAALEQQQEMLRQTMNLDNNQQEEYAWGGPGGYVNQPDNNLLAMGGMIKRADGSYSKRGLWDNIRANKGSGKKPTKQMLEQEKKIKAEYAMGGMVYGNGGKLPKEVLLPRLESHMSSEEANDYINQYGNGGYTVTRSNDRKGKTHKVTGPDGTVKYFGDSNLGQHPNDPERKKSFYARHADNIKNNPYFKAYADATWAYGGGIDNPGFKALPIEVQNNIRNNMAMGGKYVTAGDEYHRVYRNAEGDIMVNHPKEDKGKWDTINLTNKSNATTIAEGVKSVKDWHKKNPYAYGGMMYNMGGEIENTIAPAITFAHGGGIHIDPSKKGTFTAAATKHGKSVQGFASQVLANKENYSPAMVKKANFAKNASKWKHAYGGPMGMYFNGTGDEYNGTLNENDKELINQYKPEWSEEAAQPIMQIINEGLLKKFPSNSFTKDLTVPNLKYQPTQTKPTLNKPFVKYLQQNLTVPNLKYKFENKSPFSTNYKSPFGTGTSMNNNKENPPPPEEPFNYLGLTQFAGPLMDLYYGIKGPDNVNFDRVRAEQINLAPQTQADLIRRAYSTPMYLAKQQGLGQGNYLNTLAAISGKTGENIGKSYLESKLAQEQFNAQAKNATNATNAQIAMQESIARQQEKDAARSAVTKGVGEIGKGISTLSIDPKLATSQANQNKILIELLKQTNPSMNLNFLNKK